MYQRLEERKRVVPQPFIHELQRRVILQLQAGHHLGMLLRKLAAVRQLVHLQKDHRLFADEQFSELDIGMRLFSDDDPAEFPTDDLPFSHGRRV